MNMNKGNMQYVSTDEMSEVMKKFLNYTEEQKNMIRAFYDLMLCENCMQMTNHLNGVCQKCKTTAKKLRPMEK